MGKLTWVSGWLLGTIVLLSLTGVAQGNGIATWGKEYGNNNSIDSIHPASDGGYIVVADRCKDSRCQNYVFALDQEAAIAKCRYCRAEPAHFVASPHFLYLPYRTYIKPKDIQFYLRDEEIVLSPPDEIQVKTLCRGSRG